MRRAVEVMKYEFNSSKIRKLIILLSLMCALLFSAEAAKACSCMGPTDVLAGFDAAKNVAIFKVRSIEKYAEGEKGYGYGGVKQAKLTVEKVFKGKLKVGQEFTFMQGGGGDCIWTYHEKSVGVELLYFLGDNPTKDKLWAAMICTRSNSVKYAAADLLYLEKMAKVRGKTRLSGTVSQKIESSVDETPSTEIPLAGRKIRITGNGKNIELKTDQNGVYEIYGLPPGNYKITPEKIYGFKFSNDDKSSAEVKIHEEDHTEENFEFEINNSIRGKLFDSNGIALKDVCLNLIPARGTESEDFSEGDCTDENGVFLFDEIPAGTYLIVINKENEITAREPFGRFYYPATEKREDAAEITIGAGDFIKDLIVNAPQTAATITVTGVLLFEDGKPAVEKTVIFIDDTNPKKGEKYISPDARAVTDEKGRFSIRILKGRKGELYGSFSVYGGKYKDCPKLDDLMRAKGEKFFDIETPAVKIEAENDMPEMTLKFPLPYCQEES